MKNLIRYFRFDLVCTIFLLITIGIFIYCLVKPYNDEVGAYWLGACILYITRGIIWTGFDKDLIQEQQKSIEGFIQENQTLKYGKK